MDTTTIVTTFSPKNWKEYASRTIPTWLAHLGKRLDPIAMGPLGEYFDHWISKTSKKQGTSKFRQFRDKSQGAVR